MITRRTYHIFLLVVFVYYILVLIAIIYSTDVIPQAGVETTSAEDGRSPRSAAGSSAAEGGSGSGRRPSLCSPRAEGRGPRQRVVAFSFYGAKDQSGRYFSGIDANAKALRHFYPGWVMRVYHDVQQGDALLATLQDLMASYAHLDFCDVRELEIGDLSGGQQNAWRFVALADPLVEVMVSRDLDSRLSARETAAVAEWLGSPFSFHVMRDSTHHTVVMLAGTWGARTDLEPEFVVKIANELVASSWNRGRKGFDQTLLLDVVWPSIKGHILQHDSYFCYHNRFKQHGGMTPFPTQRLNQTSNYVGSIFAANDTVTRPCPMACRPKEHQDWTFC